MIEPMQDDRDPEQLFKQRDELRVKLLRAQSVITECKAELAELERRLDCLSVSAPTDERQQRSAADTAARQARPRKSWSVNDPVDPLAATFTSRSWDR
ncbi:hypothetical protein CK489_12665 [Bradyrhizobium sp. UFLA03-84]|nr:hypothetical protein CK489_12665 [Bradyrhizobium sp. UFLA03-84]